MKSFKEFKEGFDPDKFKAAMDKTSIKVDMTGGKVAKEAKQKELADFKAARSAKSTSDFAQNAESRKNKKPFDQEEFDRSGGAYTDPFRNVDPKSKRESVEEGVVDFANAKAPIGFTVTNKKTGVITNHKTRASANRKADKGDNAYGSYIHSVKAVYEDVEVLQIEQYEELAEISMRLQSKFIKKAEPKAKADAIDAEYRGDKQAQNKADRTLKTVKKLELKRMFPESVDGLEAARHKVLDHVTNTVPSNENVTKMHDLVRNVQKLGGSADNEYDNITHNITAHQKYRDAAAE